jgi:uracil-DNA glycosylase family 4
LEPDRDCSLCPRLVEFRETNRSANPGWFNAPVPSFGPIESPFLIVGLAPGLKGANLTGRPFTGDYAGDLLYATLLEFGFAQGSYEKHAGDGLELIDCRITNGVRCVPPQNKPVGHEINACRSFLTDEIASMKNLKVILSLGLVSHNTVLGALGEKRSARKFEHGGIHALSSGISLADSYHCSRYNTNTGRLTEDMFRDVFREIRTLLAKQDGTA